VPNNEIITLSTKMADEMPWISPSGQIWSKNIFKYTSLTKRHVPCVDDQI
jgi:hypothetical protein